MRQPDDERAGRAPAPPSHPRRAVAAAVAVATAGVLPVFLTGAVAVQVQADLGFGDAALGLAVGAFFAAGAATSALNGRVAERLGAGRSMRLAALASAVVLAGIAALAVSWAVLVGLLVAGGLANSLAQPATNLHLARTVRAGRQGLAFGVKQSAIPAATLLGGLAVPAVALTVGWRWAYALGAVGAAGAALAIGGQVAAPGQGRPARRARRPVGDAPLRPLVVLSLGSGLGAAAANSLGAFLVTSAVAAGLAEGQAGLLLTGGSVVGLGVRLVVGARADRRGRSHLPVVAAMLAGGTVGYALLATGAPPLLVLGTPVAFGAGWGWPGLFNLAVVRSSPAAPGAATGITQTGTYAGSVVGPLAFGAIAGSSGYGTAWLVVAVASVAAAAAVLVGRRLLVAARPSAPPAPEVPGNPSAPEVPGVPPARAVPGAPPGA